MKISAIELHNWVCYQGRQRLELGALAYAVVARRNGDPGSSNWSGKTSFLKAPGFALHGDHGARTEDMWITHGEPEGGVALWIEDGPRTIKVNRTRKRGKSTQLVVTIDDGPPAKGDEAQKIIDDLMGLTSEDFGATCYFQQRQMARMVLAKPQDRMDIVGAWLRLDPLQRAEELTRQELGELSTQHEVLKGRIATMEEAETVTLGGKTLEQLRQYGGEFGERRRISGEAKQEVAQILAGARGLAVARSKHDEYLKLAQEWKAADRDLKKLNIPAMRAQYEELEQTMQAATAEAAAATRDEQTKRRVALGQFDGRCPVAGLQCPVRDDINQKGQASRELLKTAEESRAAASRAHDTAIQARQRSLIDLQLAEQRQRQADALKARILELRPDYELARQTPGDPDHGALETRYQEACNHCAALEHEHRAVETAIERAEAFARDREQQRQKLRGLEDQIHIKREALLVFGKSGAQKRIAERALREIEEGANDMLRECGIDLSVQVQWSREGDGLAKTCDACGSPFPTSQRVKECTRCGAPRGPLLVNKLDIVLSDRSGAAEDLAGASIQLAASAWLREERGSGWSTALIDEPFGALDATNRRAFASHLTAMLRGRYGFEQAFVVSHSPDTTHMLPGRIEIECQGRRSVARVVG